MGPKFLVRASRLKKGAGLPSTSGQVLVDIGISISIDISIGIGIGNIERSHLPLGQEATHLSLGQEATRLVVVARERRVLGAIVASSV